ncbi:uncharacterized protein LOC124788535 [Schistocerca piceifrons]|uniref:uncharacterized protein LOC124788535 n=1 Tax=Schistocerca piceifrons TaxID=274613 RepID=UPI001F5E3C36|nr:uncharacterized protein LOC124788535 [Schistocerca piceifrons]
MKCLHLFAKKLLSVIIYQSVKRFLNIYRDNYTEVPKKHLIETDKSEENMTLTSSAELYMHMRINYYISEMEVLAICLEFQKLDGYLLIHKIIFYTDDKALSFLNWCRLKHTKLTKWELCVQLFDLEII